MQLSPAVMLKHSGVHPPSTCLAVHRAVCMHVHITVLHGTQLPQLIRPLSPNSMVPFASVAFAHAAYIDLMHLTSTAYKRLS